ncbi:AraC family transcriptional regulator [Aquabacterium sp.]|uniref:AraC family transcriptional regulator n=1 Tax=Aquabacterium sp. TaxID=1872578 RepID=UPI002D1BA5CA|nr:AraC family transcriptional regulator [Aquabacterium sp.]HSW04276.1 AraC family transcriptional regulator [Aquabacterium sp.]
MTPAPAHRCQVLATPWPGIECVHTESGRHFGRHWHATYGLGLLDQGAQTSASGRGEVDAHAGDVITTNPGEVHDGRPLGGPSRRWRIVYLTPEALAAAIGADAPAGCRDLVLSQPVIRDAALAQALRRLFARLAQSPVSNDARGMASDEALVEAGALLLGRHTNTAAPREVAADVRRVRERLADDMLQPPSLGELAAMVGLSKYQLLRRFRAAHGLPPHAWLLLQRAEQARRLIRGGLALAPAAAACGFADQSHMTRTFVRHFGYTPGAWQAAASRR